MLREERRGLLEILLDQDFVIGASQEVVEGQLRELDLRGVVPAINVLL